MRYAFVSAGRAFFGWFILASMLVFVFTPISGWALVCVALFAAALGGGYTFFATWEQLQQIELERQAAERERRESPEE